MIPLHRWPRVGTTLYRTFGLRGAARRVRHEWRKSTGHFLESPSASSPSTDRPACEWRLGAPGLLAAGDRERALDRALRVAGGEYQAFRHAWRPLPATPEEWLRPPGSPRPWAPHRPWWQVPHTDREGSDIKDLWEPARFGWVHDLIRGNRLTGDPRYGEAFQRYLREWAASSPPFLGPHWACGQETAIRALALLHAEANLPLGGCEKLVRDVLHASGERIADALDYALSQRNNHAISEAAGLIAIGGRFRHTDPVARAWMERGTELLEKLVAEQFADDGWYIQHSFTYLRLALEMCIMAERSLRAAGLRLSPDAERRLVSAIDLLVTVMESSTGIVPNHGASDGAFVHPITSADYRDFRPVVTAAASLWQHPLPGEIDLDVETLAWLGTPPPPVTPPRAEGLRVGVSGWVAVRTGPFELFLRAGDYRSRPGHIDPLHLDLRVGGREWLVDPGTFSYAGPPPWRNGLAGHEVHNGPTLDRRPPGVRGPRFLWYLWPSARIVEAHWGRHGGRIVAETPVARRRVVVTPDKVEITDRILATGNGRWRVRWLLHPDVDPECIETAAGARVGHGREGDPYGWFSAHYGERRPAPTLEVAAPANRDHTIVTSIRSDGRLTSTLRDPA